MKKLVTIILLGAIACTLLTSCNKATPMEETTDAPSIIEEETLSEEGSKAGTIANSTTETTTNESAAAETTKATAAETTTKKITESQGSFSASSVAAYAGGVALTPGKAYSEAAFGTPISTTQAPSCHFDGMDNIYTYSGYTLYTYTNGSSQIIYTVEITSPSIKTAAGIGVGDSLDKVLSAYGTNYASLNDYAVEYTAGGKTMFISLENNKVSMIELSV